VRADKDKLNDILSAISSIERYAVQGREAFESDELVQTWMLHYLQIIGEAARSISSVLRETHSSIPWESIIGFRNLVVHEYFRVDLSVVWEIITQDLPDLKVQIKGMLAAISEDI
jgi:uncharacterized protein with HEPN domain